MFEFLYKRIPFQLDTDEINKNCMIPIQIRCTLAMKIPRQTKVTYDPEIDP